MNMKKILAQFAGAGALIVLSAGIAHANILLDPSFESVDTTGGDVGGAGSSWGAYGTVFTTSQALPQTGTSAKDGINVLKMFGPFGGEDGNTVGAFQDFAISAGDAYTASAWALDWTNDALDGTAKFVMKFFDAGGGEIGVAENQLEKTDFLLQNVWYEIALAGNAPAGTASGQIVLVHLNNGSTGGSLFWDLASVDVTPIPVPAAVWLFGSGLVGLVGVARRRRKG